MKRFAEMSPLPIGVATIVLVVVALVAALNVTKLPFITSGTTYRAVFAEAGGLSAGDPVTLAGAQVGQVDDLTVHRGRALVEFTVTEEDIYLSARTTAAIKIETVLGSKMLELQSRGQGKLADGATIPLRRTESPYDVTAALGELTTTVSEIDTSQLSTALDTLAMVLRDTPPELRAALRGLSRFAETINSRDQALAALLDHAEGVTDVLAKRSRQLTTLLVDGNALLAELQRRREVIGKLVVNISQVSRQLTGLVNDNRQDLQPALQRLNSVLALLKRNEDNLVTALQRLGPFATALGEAVSSGPFFTAYVQNLAPANLISPEVLQDAFAPYLPNFAKAGSTGSGGGR